MSTAEMVVEKVKLLSASEAESVLNYIVRLKPSAAPTARELLRLPPEERSRILARQAETAEALYRDNPDLIVEDFDPPMDYEQGNAR